MDRVKAYNLIEKLERLASDPGATPAEAQAARGRIDAIRNAIHIKDAEEPQIVGRGFGDFTTVVDLQAVMRNHSPFIQSWAEAMKKASEAIEEYMKNGGA